MDADCELILYAEPGGALGARCEEFWAAMSTSDVTTEAQEYPPHVTLTGFFHRRSGRVPEVLTAARAAVDAAVPAGLDGGRWAAPATLELQINDDWIGLHVTAGWMDAVIAAFCAPGSRAHPVAGEDALRPKSWLHVSLAYGNGFDVHARTLATEHAEAFAGLASEAVWTIAVWRRDGPVWERLLGIPIGV